MLKLDSFEEDIYPSILSRGQDYFTRGCVHDILEIHKGVFRASVDGSEMYTITIGLKGGRITTTDCTCPYEDGICKHIVA